MTVAGPAHRGRVAVVTDSTAYLPAGLLPDGAVTVVPVQVVVAGTAYDEGEGITPGEVAAALREWKVVTTSRPTTARFEQTYARLAEEGATGIVSIHLSAQLSGTYEAAVVAARGATVPTRVVDSASVAMGLGWAAVTAAAAAQEGRSIAEIADTALARATGATVLFYVDTLEYLRRGGRIGAAQAIVGQALSVKPILTLDGGRVRPLEKVRTGARALLRLEALALEAAAERDVDLAVHHLDSLDRAEALAARLEAALPDARVVVSEVGAVVGTHVGPGMVGVVVSPRP